MPGFCFPAWKSFMPCLATYFTTAFGTSVTAAVRRE